MTKTVVVLGAAGMLGHTLCREFSQHPAYHVIGTVRQPVSVYQKKQAVFSKTTLRGDVNILEDDVLEQLFLDIKPDVVINAIGIVKQLAAANDRFLSVAINAYLPHKLVQLGKQYQTRIIHISTDCVFDGAKGNYHETDLSDAEDIYGKSKFLGETDESEKNAITIRSSIIGHELNDDSRSLVDWFLSNRGKTIKGFKKAFYSGVTTHEMANIIMKVIDDFPHLYGLYQVASERITKYDLLMLINEVYGAGIQIQADENFFCDRSLIMDRFSKDTGYVVPSWPQMIETMHKAFNIYGDNQ